MAQMVRMQIEPLFIRPFGEVNLGDLLLTARHRRRRIAPPTPRPAATARR